MDSALFILVVDADDGPAAQFTAHHRLGMTRDVMERNLMDHMVEQTSVDEFMEPLPRFHAAGDRLHDRINPDEPDTP